MKKIYLGQTDTRRRIPIDFGKYDIVGDDPGDRIELDLEAENIHTILLTGQTGSGKSVFHNHLYKELTEKYTPEEIQFVFLDMTLVDFAHWKGPYITIDGRMRPNNKSVEILEELGEKMEKGYFSKESRKITFLQIEECDMIAVYPERFVRALERLLKTRHESSFYFVYSTSKMVPEFILPWLHLVDMKIVFKVANPADSCMLLGNNLVMDFSEPGERIMAWKNLQIPCRPFPEEYKNKLEEFRMTDKGVEYVPFVPLLK